MADFLKSISDATLGIAKIAEKFPTSFVFLILSWILVFLAINHERAILLAAFLTLFYAVADHRLTTFRKLASDSKWIKRKFDNESFMKAYTAILWILFFVWVGSVLKLLNR